MSVKMRIVAVGVASLLVLLLWFGVVYHPGSAKLGKLRQDVASAQAQESQLQTQLATLLSYKRDAATLQADSARFTRALPDSPSVSDFIRLVQDAANKSGIDFLSVQPSLPSAVSGPAAPAAPAPATSPAPSATPAATPAAGAPATAPTLTTTSGGLQAITVSIAANGSFFPMKDFLHRLEHLPRALRVSSLSIGGGGPTAGSAPLQVSMSLAIFVAPPPVAAGPSVVTSPAPGA